MSAFKAVFFDMGGTVLEIRGVATAYRRILHKNRYPVRDEQVRVWLAAARKATGPHPLAPSPRPGGRGTLDGFSVDAAHAAARRAAAVDAFLDQAEVRARREACRAAIVSSWVGTEVFGLYPDVPAVLATLKRAGLVLGAVSNWESRLPELCASHGIAGYFDFICSSEAEGQAKPGTRLFEIALERAGVAASTAVHVGDHELEDVQAAESAGIRAILVRRSAAETVAHSPTISSLEQLPALVLSDGWLRGRVVSGKGEAAGFTGLPWVRRQVAERLGFELYPGTLNLRIERAEDLAFWARLRDRPGVPVEPSPGYCAARCFRVSVEGRSPGAIVLPLVPWYPSDTVEVLAPVVLRQALPVEDGDEVTLAIAPTGP